MKNSILSDIISPDGDNTITVLTISDGRWFESSENIGENFRLACGAKSCKTLAIDSDNFKRQWVTLTSEYVIIHSHGSATGLFDEKQPQNTIITVPDIAKLKKNTNVRCVIIIACEAAGATADNTDNITQAFSRRIADTGVALGSGYILTGGDDEFYVDMQNVQNAWKIYRAGELINNSMPNRVVMKDIFTYLKKNNYI